MLATCWLMLLVVDAPSRGVDIRGVLTWGAALIGLFIVAGLVWNRARRWLTSKSPLPSADQEGWTLDDLRGLKSAGLVSDEEYQRLRAKLIESIKGALGGAGGASENVSPPSPSDKGEPRSGGTDQSGSNEGQAG